MAFMNARAGLLVVGLSLVGCASAPPPPVVPDGEYEYEFQHEKTGEQLVVKGKSYIYTTNERVEVAQRDMYDSAGRRIGSDRIYANQQVAHQGYSWNVYQGSKPIDVLSALHIARDVEFKKAFNRRIEQINEDRENALPYYEKVMKQTEGSRKVGLALGIVGVSAGIALIIIGAAVTPGDNSGVHPGFTWGAVGGFVVGGIGGSIYGVANAKRRAGAAKAQEMADAHVSPSDFPRLTTEAYVTEVAEKYNDGIAAPPPPPPKKDDKKKKKKH